VMTLKCQEAVPDVASRDLDPDLALLPIAAISGTFGQVLSRVCGEADAVGALDGFWPTRRMTVREPSPVPEDQAMADSGLLGPGIALVPRQPTGVRATRRGSLSVAPGGPPRRRRERPVRAALKPNRKSAQPGVREVSSVG